MSLSQLSLPSSIKRTKPEGIELIEIENEFAKAVITTHGASVLSYQPQNQQDLLWVSSEAVFDGSKPVRGGIPICWPWFGNATTEGWPAHGFVRNQVWQLEKAEQLENGHTSITLQIEHTEQSKRYFSPDFKLSLKVEVGPKLRLTLSTKLQGTETAEITEALHTYFNIANPETLKVSGLAGSMHFDKLDETKPAEPQGDLVELLPPRDSVYQNQSNDMVIHDTENQRNIHIKTDNVRSAVIWNPGPEIVKSFSDINNQGWKEFACVEPGNVLSDAQIVTPEKVHRLTVEYWIENYSSK